MNFIKTAIMRHKVKKKMGRKIMSIRERMDEEKKLREKSAREAMDVKIRAFKELEAPVLKGKNDERLFLFEGKGNTYKVKIGLHGIFVKDSNGKEITRFIKDYCINLIDLNTETNEAKIVLEGKDIILYQYRKDKDVLLIHKFMENGDLYVEMPCLKDKEVATLKVNAPMDFEIVNIHDLITLDLEEGEDEQNNYIMDYFRELIHEDYNAPAYRYVTCDIDFGKMAEESDDFWKPFYSMLQYLVYCYYEEYKIKKDKKIEKQIIESNLKSVSTNYKDIEQNLELIFYEAIATAIYGEFVGRLNSISVIEDYYKLCKMRGCEFEKDEFIGGWTYMGYYGDKYEVVNLFDYNAHDDYNPEDIYEYFLWLKSQYDHAQKPLLENNTWYNEYFTMIDIVTGEFLAPDYLKYVKLKGMEKPYQSKLLAQAKQKGWKVSTKLSSIEPSKELLDSFQL